MRKYVLFFIISGSLVSCNQDDDSLILQKDPISILYSKGGEEIDSTYIPPPLYAEEGDPPPKSGSGNGGKPAIDSVKIN